MILRDISEADLSSLLRFMYHGEVRIEEERLKDFMRTAETLQIRGLFGGGGGDNAPALDANAHPDDDAAARDSKEVGEHATERIDDWHILLRNSTY